jgi:hypothetical protein
MLVAMQMQSLPVMPHQPLTICLFTGTVFTVTHVTLHVRTSFSVIVHVVLQTTVVQPQSLHFHMHATAASEMCPVTVCTCQAPICLVVDLGIVHVLLMHLVHPVLVVHCASCAHELYSTSCTSVGYITV